MSGTNFLAVDAVSSNSEVSSGTNARQTDEAPVELPGAVRQTSAVDGNNLPNAQAEQEEAASREAVQQALDTISDNTSGLARDIEFSINEDLDQVIVTVLDSASEEVIRQIPGEQAIAIAERLASVADEQDAIGLLLDSLA